MRIPAALGGIRLDEVRRTMKFSRAVRRRMVTPLPERFGAFGASFIVPPVRIEFPEYVYIGDGVHVLEHCWFSVYKKFDDIEPRFVVGDRARLGRFCQFSIVGNTIIEEDAGISDCVLIADTSHDYTDPSAPWFRQEMHRPKPVVVGAGAAIGYGAILLPGVRIGPHAYVGENSVVGEDVPRGAVVAGNPARVVPAREGAAKRRP